MIKLVDINKEYNYGKNNSCKVFSNTDYDMGDNSAVAIRGRSGSGKSTLLSIIAGLDLKYSGDYYFKQKLLSKDREDMADYRLQHIGIITQNYHLLTDRNVFNNIAFPLQCKKMKRNDILDKVRVTMDLLKLNDLQKKYPSQLSGGQCQRVAIARALVKNPDLILADEPTGALDETSEQEVLKVLSLLIEKGQRIIIATHSQQVADYCSAEYKISNYKLTQVR